MATTRQAISWARKNYNFITPHMIKLVRIKSLPNTFVELAEGDFLEKSIFGVSIIKWDNEKQDFTTNHEYSEDYNKSLYTRETAEHYFDWLTKTFEHLGKATIWK
jgi:hypothetical protein